MLNKFRNKSTGSKTIAEPSPLEKVALIDLNIPSLPNAMATCTEQLSTAYLKTGKLYIYAWGITIEKRLVNQRAKNIFNKIIQEKSVNH